MRSPTMKHILEEQLQNQEHNILKFYTKRGPNDKISAPQTANIIAEFGLAD